MKTSSTGVSMGGGILHTRGKKHYTIMKKKDNQKIKRAKICIECKSNAEGFCKRHNAMCYIVNKECTKMKGTKQQPQAKTIKKQQQEEQLQDKTLQKQQQGVLKEYKRLLAARNSAKAKRVGENAAAQKAAATRKRDKLLDEFLCSVGEMKLPEKPLPKKPLPKKPHKKKQTTPKVSKADRMANYNKGRMDNTIL